MKQEKIQPQIKSQNMLNYLEGLAFFDELNLSNTLIVCGSLMILTIFFTMLFSKKVLKFTKFKRGIADKRLQNDVRVFYSSISDLFPSVQLFSRL